MNDEPVIDKMKHNCDDKIVLHAKITTKNKKICVLGKNYNKISTFQIFSFFFPLDKWFSFVVTNTLDDKHVHLRIYIILYGYCSSMNVSFVSIVNYCICRLDSNYHVWILHIHCWYLWWIQTNRIWHCMAVRSDNICRQIIQ